MGERPEKDGEEGATQKTRPRHRPPRGRGIGQQPGGGPCRRCLSPRASHRGGTALVVGVDDEVGVGGVEHVGRQVEVKVVAVERVDVEEIDGHDDVLRCGGGHGSNRVDRESEARLLSREKRRIEFHAVLCVDEVVHA